MKTNKQTYTDENVGVVSVGGPINNAKLSI